jgi:hypothetical protein
LQRVKALIFLLFARMLEGIRFFMLTS